MKTMFFTFWSLLVLTVSVYANDYTAVFLEEERDTSVSKPWLLGLGATSITNHPVLEIQAARLSALYRTDVRYRVGGSVRFNKQGLNSSTELMNQRLVKEGKEVQAQFSEMIIGGEFQFLPLMGHVSFMDKASLATLFGVSLELARTVGGPESTNILYPGIFFELETMSNLYISLFAKQFVEINDDQESFTEVGIGVSIAL